MNNVIITIEHNNGILALKQSIKELGSQYDNEAQRLMFNRPEDRQNDDLILYFFDGVTKHDPINIGTENTFIITSDLTQRSSPRYSLSLQIAFERNSVILEHSNIISFSLRSSVSAASAGPSLNERVNSLESDAFVGVTYQDSKLAFQNVLGVDVGSVWVTSGGSSGGTTNHAALSNLGYEQSGHTGFASVADVVSKADVTALTAHENDMIKHTTQAEKDAINTIPDTIARIITLESTVGTLNTTLKARLDGDA